MGRVISPKFNVNGDLDGLQSVNRATSRPEDAATLKRLTEIQDPGNSAAFFQQKLAALESAAPERKLNNDPGLKT